MKTICVWCRRDGRTSADIDESTAIAGLCHEHIRRFTAEVDAALREQSAPPRTGALPPTDRLHRTTRRVRDTLLQQVRDVLLRYARMDLCDACVAGELAARVADVEAAATKLAASPEYLRDEWRCHRCGSRRIVTRARTVPAAASTASPSSAA